MDILSGITAASHGLSIAKALRGIGKDYDAATYKVQIVDLIDALTDAKMALTDAREELENRQREVERLKNSFAEREDLVKADGDYKYYVGMGGRPIGYPICPKCEVDGKIIQIKEDQFFIQGRCPVCANVYRPVTCYLPYQEGGPQTRLEADAIEQAERSERLSDSIARLGNRLA